MRGPGLTSSGQKHVLGCCIQALSVVQQPTDLSQPLAFTAVPGAGDWRQREVSRVSALGLGNESSWWARGCVCVFRDLLTEISRAIPGLGLQSSSCFHMPDLI